MWSLYQSGGSNYYHQLTGTYTGEDDFASANFTGTGSEDLIADFASLGLWLYKSDFSGWVKISSMNCNRIKEVRVVGAQDYELLAQENVTQNLYWGNWNGTGFTWTQINCPTVDWYAFCETFDYDGTDSDDEEVVIALEAGGCVMFDYSAGEIVYSWLGSVWPIRFMVKGDYYGRGYDSTMAFVFASTSSSPGLWLYDKTAGWTHISSEIPDDNY
jgi:hypothetical protein